MNDQTYTSIKSWIHSFTNWYKHNHCHNTNSFLNFQDSMHMVGHKDRAATQRNSTCHGAGGPRYWTLESLCQEGKRPYLKYRRAAANSIVDETELDGPMAWQHRTNSYVLYWKIHSSVLGSILRQYTPATFIHTLKTQIGDPQLNIPTL